MNVQSQQPNPNENNLIDINKSIIDLSLSSKSFINTPAAVLSKNQLSADNEDAKYANYMREKLFDAVSRGDIEEVDNLLDLPYADLNTTWVCHTFWSRKMAEYLICKGIDVAYEVDLFEFHENSKIPIKYMYYSCREMAYDHEMHNIVQLIDFFHEETNKKIVEFIGKKYFKLSSKENVNTDVKEELRRLYKKRLESIFLPNKKQHTGNTNIDANNQEHNESLNPDELKLDLTYDDVDRVKLKSDRSLDYVLSLDETLNGIGSVSTPKARLAKDMQTSITKRYISSNVDNFFSFNDVCKQKTLNYRGYKLTFDINYVDTSKSTFIKRPQSSKQPLAKCFSTPTNNNNNNKSENLKSESSLISNSVVLTNPVVPAAVTTTTTKNVTFTPRQRPKTSYLSKSNKDLSSSLSTCKLRNSMDSSIKRHNDDADQRNIYVNKREQIRNSYLNSLKKSGLWNNFCTPIIHSSKQKVASKI